MFLRERDAPNVKGSAGFMGAAGNRSWTHAAGNRGPRPRGIGDPSHGEPGTGAFFLSTPRRPSFLRVKVRTLLGASQK